MKLLQNAPILFTLVAVVAAVVFVGAHVLDASTEPSGPVDVVWDREICAHCRMHIGEPQFAAQVQTAEGDVLCFDDPGCLFQMLEAAGLSVRATYFRHHDEDRWIPAEKTAFVTVVQSPMGFGFAATDIGTPEAIPLDEARRRMLGSGGR